MAIPKNSGGLVPDPIDVGGLTEIRVHGVGGTGPEDLLGDMSPTRVAGDRIAGFYRTADAAGRHREAYSWGGLTSHSPLRVLWLLLTPSMLANMAGWMARRRIMNGKSEEKEEPTTPCFRWCARVAALALTLSTAVMVTMLSLDTFAYQCLGQHPCRDRLWGTSVLDFIAPYDRPGLRLAAGVIAPVAVVAVFYILASRSRASYEGVEPPVNVEPSIEGKARTPVSSSRCAAAQEGGLRSAEFWSGRRWHEHLSLLHLAVGVAVAAGMLGWCVSALAGSMNLSDDGAVVTAQVAGAASIIVVVLVGLLLAWDDAQENLALGVFFASVLDLAVAFTAAMSWPLKLIDARVGGPEAVSQPVGILPGIRDSANLGWGLTLLLLVPLILQQAAAWLSRWRYARKEVPPGQGRIRRLKASVRGSIKVFPWAAPVVLNVVALVLGNAVLLSLMVLVANALGSLEYGSGPDASTVRTGVEAGGADGRSVLWVPKEVVFAASILNLYLLAVLALFSIIVAVWLSMTSGKKAPRVRKDLESEYLKAGETGAGSVVTIRGPVETASQKRDAWVVSAFNPDPFSPKRERFASMPDRGRPSPWVRRVALVCLIAKYAPSLVAWLMIVIAALSLVGAVIFLHQVWVLNQAPMMSMFWVQLGTTVGALLPAVYVLVARLAFRNEKWRKILMSPFDVGTFFPRSFHPFAPPSYTERAVPELTRRIWWLHDNEGRVVLAAHSQGSVVAAAVVVRESSRQEEGKRIGLVTFGCPLGKLYRWAFPALLSDGLLQSIAKGSVGIGEVSWRNVNYSTDYIGGPVRVKGEWDPIKPDEPDVHLVDPATDKFMFGQPPPHILSHTGYWVDARFWGEVDRMCEKILPAPPAPGVGAHPTMDSASRQGELVSPDGARGLWSRLRSLLFLEPRRADEVASESSPYGSVDFIDPDPTIPQQYRCSSSHAAGS